MGDYGRTIVTSDPAGRETEDEREILLQWCEHTLQTRRGTLRTAPDHGIDLALFLLAATDPAVLLSIEDMVQAALERGRLVASARVAATRRALGGGRYAVRLEIQVQGVSGTRVELTREVGPEAADEMAREAA